MIVRNLPPPELFLTTGTTAATTTGKPVRTPLIFHDHTLFTGTTTGSYAYPEHIPGMGILAMLSGTGRYTVNRRKETLDQDHFLLLNQGSRLGIHLPSPGIQPLFLYFHSALATEIMKQKGVDWRWLERAHPLPENLRQRLQSLAAMRDNCSSFAALKADAMIRAILEDIFGQARTAVTSATRLPAKRRTTRVELFKQLSTTKEWIEANYTSPIMLNQMAQVANLNSQHFLRMFRDCYGVTPHRFLTDIRLNAARHQIENSQESISTICQQTGFESLPTFSRLFRQRFNLSPSSYRRDQTQHQTNDQKHNPNATKHAPKNATIMRRGGCSLTL
jgi:AraC family transcriptional regulator